jgi:hypothetical protein|tara:strand:+ start:568 stop:780 length:213 start_codon:yes stop_codon:yes gene_type:complete
MTYKNIEPFVKEYGVRKSFFVDYFKKQEKQGKSKNEIQAEAIRNEIVKSPLVLNRTYKFYEIVKDEIGWI